MEKLETKSFLIGYFYAATLLINHPWNEDLDYVIDSKSGQIPIFLKNGGKMITAINRGISPIIGRVPYCLKNLEDSWFDIVDNWTVPEIWNHLTLGMDKEDYFDEVRISFNELVETINHFGGLDLPTMLNFINECKK